MGLWAFDRYVQKGPYAYISWETIKENFHHGFQWDNDHLGTNMFAHPYNGSMYYNAGRSNGYNYWQSGIFAVAGSAMWEMCMEREYPSTNDIIATPVGGMALGEVFYRASDLVLDDRTWGAERAGRELAAFIIDPMRGINRLVSGRSWHRHTSGGPRYGMPSISLDFFIGGRSLTLIDTDNGTKVGLALGLEMEYGNRFAEADDRPYDYFKLRGDFNLMKTQPVLSRVEIIGRLLSREIHDTERSRLSVGLYQHFDYFDSDTIKAPNHYESTAHPCVVPYKLGTPASFGGGIMWRFAPTAGTCLDASLHANGVLLAGILTDYYRDYHRNYNWGSGFSIKGDAELMLIPDRLYFNFSDRFYWLYTWNGYGRHPNWAMTPEGAPQNTQGDKSRATFNCFEADLKYRLAERFHILFGIDVYHRVTKYLSPVITASRHVTHSDEVRSSQLSLQLGLLYSF